MKKILLALSFLFCFQIVSSAQYGISIAYKSITAKNWESIIIEHKAHESVTALISPFSEGIHFGVDYWFRLKNYRVEFVPELNVSKYTRFWEKEIITEQITTNFIGFHFNTNFYVFDLKGDCDCPTFSKDGNDIAKGFFIQLAPGINYIANSYREVDNTRRASDFAPSAGIGVGVDIGLSDFLTITPMLKYQRYFNVEWEGLNEYFDTDQPLSPELNTNHIDQVFAGVKIGLRFDELNKY